MHPPLHHHPHVQAAAAAAHQGGRLAQGEGGGGTLGPLDPLNNGPTPPLRWQASWTPIITATCHLLAAVWLPMVAREGRSWTGMTCARGAVLRGEASLREGLMLLAGLATQLHLARMVLLPLQRVPPGEGRRVTRCTSMPSPAALTGPPPCTSSPKFQNAHCTRCRLPFPPALLA